MSIAVTFGMVSTHEGITKPSVFALVVIDARLDHTLWSVHGSFVKVSMSFRREFRSSTLASPRMWAS